MIVGSIEAIWRFPVKSFKGEEVKHAELTAQGVLGDRAYALIDKKTGKVVSAKSVKLFPDLLHCAAVFTSEPKVGTEMPPVKITLVNGDEVLSNSPDVDQRLSEYFKREVTLAKVAPPDFTIDQYHPDVDNLSPQGHRDISVEQKLGVAFFNEVGMDSPVSQESFMDLFPLSLITSATLDQLTKLRPESNFDVSRFRMNLVLKVNESGFVENDWIGKGLTIGSNIQFIVTMPDPRCVMVTLSQQDMNKDTNVLRSLVEHNRIQVGESGKFPCAGVYAVVTTPGVVQAGDPVTIN